MCFSTEVEARVGVVDRVHEIYKLGSIYSIELFVSSFSRLIDYL